MFNVGYVRIVGMRNRRNMIYNPMFGLCISFSCRALWFMVVFLSYS